jgi:CRISPR-associated protein Cas1
MTTLFVDRKGIAIRLDGRTLVFEEGGQRVGCVPIGPLERVVLRGDVTLQASLLGKLGEAGVGLLVLSGRRGEPSLALPRPHHDARRRVAQWRASDDAARRVALARGWVAGKLAAQQAWLAERAALDAMNRYELTTAVRRLDALRDDVAAADSCGRLRGLEGAAAQAYFGGLRTQFAPSLRFSSRNRRPPRDPVNAVLSLGYTLLHAEAVLQAHAAGLDPFVGFLHETDFARESLACDLVEPHRTGVDRLAVRLFRERELEVDHFSTTQGACLLGKAGRERFYRAWEPAAEGLRRALRTSCLALVRELTGDEAANDTAAATEDAAAIEPCQADEDAP